MTTVIDKTWPEHSRFGGSIADRWMNCPGSVALCDTVPKRASSAYADEGTWAHALAAYCLEQGYRDANAFKAMSLPMGVEVPPQYSGQVCGEIVEAVNVYLSEVFAELDLSADAELFIEQDFVLDVAGAEPGEVFGRNDAMVWHPSTGRLRVFDYKHGAGVLVDARDNAQLKFYAAGAVFTHDWGVKDLILTIVQPRPFAVEIGKEDAVKDWDIPIIDLHLFMDDASEAIRTAKAVEEAVVLMGAADLADLKAGDHCRWCDAAAVCPAREQQALQVAQLGFSSVINVTVDQLPDAKTLDMDRLERIVAGAELLSDYAQQCRNYLEGLLMGGHRAKLFKVVEKIGRRKYVVGDEEVVDHLDITFGVPRDVATRVQLQTITEMKKILKQYGATAEQIEDFEARFTLKDSSGLTMAHVSDKRPAVTPSASDYASVTIPTVV